MQANSGAATGMLARVCAAHWIGIHWITKLGTGGVISTNPCGDITQGKFRGVGTLGVTLPCLHCMLGDIASNKFAVSANLVPLRDTRRISGRRFKLPPRDH